MQAVARDLLAASMLRLEANGYPVVLHCHDEAVAETAEGFGSLEEFLSLMTTVPDWAAGVPLAAKAWCRVNYAKPQKEPTTKQTGEKNERHNSMQLPVHLHATGEHKADHEALQGRRSLAADGGGNGAIPVRSPLCRADRETGFNGVIKQFPPGEFAHIPLVDLIGQPLQNGKIQCPWHADTTPSLHIYSDGFHCFACGVRGDHIDWLMTIEGMTRAQAIDKLFNWDGPIAPIRSQEEEDEKARKRMAAALYLWEASKQITGTRAIKYLADVRGIDTDLLPTDDNALRYHPRCPFDRENIPCLIARYSDVRLTPSPVFIGSH